MSTKVGDSNDTPTMRAVFYTGQTKTGNLSTVGTLPRPAEATLEPGQVLVKVYAAGVTGSDARMRRDPSLRLGTCVGGASDYRPKQQQQQAGSGSGSGIRTQLGL